MEMIMSRAPWYHFMQLQMCKDPFKTNTSSILRKFMINDNLTQIQD